MDRLKQSGLRSLRWLEKYTKTDMVYLAHGSFWAIASKIVITLTTFLLAIAFAHFISKESYGQYKYVLSIISILSAFTLTGLNTAVLESVSRGFEGTLRYAFWKNIKWSVLFFLGTGIVSIYYYVQNNHFLATAILITGCLWPFFISTNLYSSFLNAKKDFRRNAIYFDMLGNIFPAASLILTMALTSNPLWIISAYIFSNTLIGVILYYKITNVYKPNSEVDPEMLGYSKHLSLMNILAVIGDNIDQILVFHYVGAAQLAIYNFATAIPDQIKGPLKNLTSMMFPKFTERSDEEIRSGMKNKFLYLFVFSIILIIIYVLTAPYIFRIFFPKYTDSVIYSQIFSISLLWMVSIPADTYLNAKKKVKELYIGTILGALTQIAFVFAAVILGGLMGLILARVAIRLVFSIISISLYNRTS